MHKTLPNFLSHIISHIAHYVALLLILILNFSLSKKKKTQDSFEGGREGGRVRWTRDKLSRTLSERPRPRWFLNKAEQHQEAKRSSRKGRGCWKMTKGMNGWVWRREGGSLSRGFGFWEIEANSQLPPLVECRGTGARLLSSTFPSSCPLPFALLATLMSLIWLKESAVRIF